MHAFGSEMRCGIVSLRMIYVLHSRAIGRRRCCPFSKFGRCLKTAQPQGGIVDAVSRNLYEKASDTANSAPQKDAKKVADMIRRTDHHCGLRSINAAVYIIIGKRCHVDTTTSNNASGGQISTLNVNVECPTFADS